MNDLIIYGAGGFGREIALLVEQVNENKRTWNVVGFVDDGKAKKTIVDGYEVLGGAEFLEQVKHGMSIVIAVAEPAVRKRIVSSLKTNALEFPVLVHPNANMGSRTRNTLGKGSIIAANNVLTTGVHIGNFNIVNLSCTLGHDVITDEFCTIMPGANISGNVRVGACTLIGTGCQILQNLSVGSNCKIGAGAVVTKSLGSDLVAIGVPAITKP